MMPRNNLAEMNDGMLLKLFEVNGDQNTPRARQVRAELERRGYLYDPVRHTFVSCEQWNRWHPTDRRDCNEEARQRQQRDGG